MELKENVLLAKEVAQSTVPFWCDPRRTPITRPLDIFDILLTWSVIPRSTIGWTITVSISDILKLSYEEIIEWQIMGIFCQTDDSSTNKQIRSRRIVCTKLRGLEIVQLYSSYFLLEPFTFSTGYFLAFNFIFRRAAWGRSMSQQSKLDYELHIDTS